MSNHLRSIRSLSIKLLFLMTMSSLFLQTGIYAGSEGFVELTQEELAEIKELSKQGLFDVDLTDCTSTSLNLAKLCARLIKAGCIRSQKVITNELCADVSKVNTECISSSFNADNICTTTLNAQRVCTKDLYAKHTWTEDARTNELCAKLANAEVLNASQINTNQLCAQAANVENLSVDVAQFNTLCSEVAFLKQLVADQIFTNSLCAQQINAKDLCADSIVSQTLSVNQFLNCNTFKAELGFLTDTDYILGTTMNFDSVLFDPNFNTSFVPYSHYTVPLSGIYIATVQVNSFDLVGTSTVPANNVIGGIPVGQVDLLVNGILRRRSLTPFLSFFTTQQSNLTTVFPLNTGDIITIRFAVLVIDQNTGVVEYEGKTTLVGGGDSEISTIFNINYLSSTVCPTLPGSCSSICPVVDIPCQPVTINCLPVDVTCPPVTVDCSLCQPTICTPCLPCPPPDCPCVV